MKKKYQVVGRNEVLDHQPGTVFEAQIPADQEARLLERGSLIRVDNGATKTPNKEKK
jgi:hypothetical protein